MAEKGRDLIMAVVGSPKVGKSAAIIRFDTGIFVESVLDTSVPLR
jgi:hypothetical protein